MVCSVMTAALACVTLVLELKEHRSRRRLELLTCGLHGEMAEAWLRIPLKVSRSGAGECA